jgi:hypothetical protein
LRLTARSAPAAARGVKPSPSGGRKEAGEDLTERSLVTLMLRFPAVMDQMELEQDLDRLLSPQWNRIVQAILTQWRKKNVVDPAALAEEVSPELASHVSVAWLEGENLDETECEKMTMDCLSHLKKRYLRRLERELRQAIRLAEEKKDDKVKKERMLEWQEVVRKERQLERQRLALKS